MAYPTPDRNPSTRLIISVDGEGKNLPMTPDMPCYNPHVFDLLPDGDNKTTARGWHSYTMLAAGTDTGYRRSITHNGTRRELTTPEDPDLWVGRNYGLSTVDCLEFLLNLHQRHRSRADALIISFYFDYDVVKLLADLPVKRLKDLAATDIPPNYGQRKAYLKTQFGLTDQIIERCGSEGRGLITAESTIWKGYYISYTPRKRFHIIDLKAGRIRDPYDQGKTPRYMWAREVIVWDVFGFYQTSFVKALDGARTSTGDPLCPPEVIERIQAMKDQRGEFANLPDDKILEYCYEECHYLSAMFRNTLRHIASMPALPGDVCKDGTPKSLLSYMTSYHGSGALASAWLKSRKIKDYMQPRPHYTLNSKHTKLANLPEQLPESIALAAYFGGRFEVSDIGYMGDMYSYDINSAYPAALATLPCLAHGTWERVSKYVANKPGVYEVGSLTDPITHAYTLPNNNTPRFAPFPFRPDDKYARQCGLPPKSVLYAHGGRRWVWQDEVKVARQHYGESPIPIYDGWVYTQHCNHRPFGEIPDMYQTRRELKRKRDGAQMTYKLAYNSLYGKLAQSVGWSVSDSDSAIITPPQFQSFIWAGMITSWCRAQILNAICQPGADVTSIATDGILSRTPIPTLTCSAELGDWEYGHVTSVYLFASGVYTMISHDDSCTDPKSHLNTEHGKCKRKYATRGFSTKEIGYQQLIDAWENGETTVSPIHDTNDPPTRFVTLRGGIHREHALDVIGQWIPSRHDVQINHTRRLPPIDEFGIPDLTPINGILSSTPFIVSDDKLSAPYTPKQTWEDVINEYERIMGSGDHLDATAADLDAILPSTQTVHEEMP